MKTIRNQVAQPPSLFARMGVAVRRARQRRAAMRELGRLNGHLLADIGIAREDIPAVVDAMVAGGRSQVARPAAEHDHAGLDRAHLGVAG